MVTLTQQARMAAIVAQVCPGGVLTSAYAGLSNQQIADSLNAPSSAYPTASVNLPVPTADALAILLGSPTMAWAQIKQGSADSQPASTLKAICVTVVDAITQLESLSPAYVSTIEAALAALETAGLLDSATQTALLGLMTQTVQQSWAQINADAADIGPIQAREVQLAQGPASAWGGT